MKKRVLFVDDEPEILSGLQDRLRRQRRKWKMSFVGGGHEALELMANERIDVIVSDMRMPQMDGATLLKRVQDEHPEVARIVLSGHAEFESSLRAVSVAHQFLSKPCDAGVLENVVERACNLQALINDDVVRQMVGKIQTLPSLPKVYSQLIGALSGNNATIDEVARILKQDMGMCAKLLQVVNSSFFRLSRTINKVEEAVTYLGFESIKQIALTVEVFGQSGDSMSVGGQSAEELQRHSMFCATVATKMFDDQKKREDVFIAALLHDVGKLLLAMDLPDHIKKVEAAMGADGGPMHAAEEAVCGVTHAEVGAYLLGLWGLPYPIVEAVASHHVPSRVEQQGFDILAAVHVADALAHELLAPEDDGTEQESVEVDQAFLDDLGVGSRMAEWRALAEKQADAISSGS